MRDFRRGFFWEETEFFEHISVGRDIAFYLDAPDRLCVIEVFSLECHENLGVGRLAILSERFIEARAPDLYRFVFVSEEIIDCDVNARRL